MSWFQRLLESLRRLVSGLGRTVDRFYVETRAGSTRRWFLLTPLVWNNLDTDGTGGADLRIRITFPVAVPPDGLTIRIERVGSGTADVSALVFIGVDDGVFPPGTLPAQMDFAFLGLEGGSGRVAPDQVTISFRQRAAGTDTEVTANVGARNAQSPLSVRAGLMTSPVHRQQARGGVLGGPVEIRAGDIALATELTDVRLDVALPSGGTVTLNPPIDVAAVSGTAGTTVDYSAPAVLSLDADVTTRGQTSTRALIHTSRMPASLSASVAASELVLHPAEPLTADARAVGLGLPLGFTSASARFTVPGLPLRVAWGPAPLLIDVGLQAGTAETLAAKLSARLLTAPQAIGSLALPPQPPQALVAEYIEGQELWAGINALGGLHVEMEQTGPTTSAAASLTLAEPLADGSPSVSPRSIRLSARTANRLTADVRASQLEADAAGRGGPGTLSAKVALDAAKAAAEISGRLRHVRALYNDGAARTEAWTVATPARLALAYENTDRLRFSVVPDWAMAVTADRTAVGAGGGVGGFARLFARLLVNSQVRGHYAMPPRQPVVQGAVAAGSTPSIHLDGAGTTFPPELIGMSLRYESGANAGQTRTITGAGGQLATDSFEFTPTAGDAFVVVSRDVLLQATDKLAHPSTRRGISATVSAGRARGQRVATRIHPQVVQQTSRRWIPLVTSPGPDETDALAARIEGILSVTLPPPNGAGQGPLAADIELDATRPRRSLRYAQNRRWILPESVRQQLELDRPSELRPIPRVRALLADVPDSITFRQVVSAAAETYSLSRSGGGNQGWVWALTEQQRWDKTTFLGLGVISLDITAIPQRVGVILASNLADVRRRTPPGDVMWTPSSGWLLPSSQTVTVSGDLGLARLVYAAFWPGRTGRSDGTAQTYPTRDEDQWDLTTVSLLTLHDTGAADQRLTIWTLDGRDWDNPDRAGGIGIEAVGLNADLDLDRYRALLSPGVRSYFSIPWIKQVEIQLQTYVGAWLLSGGLGPDYERPAEDTGFWFLRAINKIPGIGDAYFGNTSGNINGRQRLYP